MLLVAQNRKERQPSAALPQSILLEARFRRFRGVFFFAASGYALKLASIAHEVNQPARCRHCNGDALLRRLGPDEARGAVKRMIR
jgi:hypothetical protein